MLAMLSKVWSLRFRLILLWLLLLASGTVTGFLFYEFYTQSAKAQIGRAEEAVVRGCRDITDRYRFFVTGWSGGAVDSSVKDGLRAVAVAALARAPGVEGGVWQAEMGAVVYSFPTYEGSGPKTDLPAAELPAIRQVNEEALRQDRPVTIHQQGRSQVLLLHACPLPGAVRDLTAWTMTRTYTGTGPAYNQLLIGFSVLALTVLGSAGWLAHLLYSWTRKLDLLQSALAADKGGEADLPFIQYTGERELDDLVAALNRAGERLSRERRRAATAERLAAVGRLSAGLAHEIRNPIAAMRLKAENALAAGDDSRRTSALRTILLHIDRLDALLRDLLATTHQSAVEAVPIDVAAYLSGVIDAHSELAASHGVMLRLGELDIDGRPAFDESSMRRALDNLILNAIQNAPAGGLICLNAGRQDGRLVFTVKDTGPGVPPDIHDRVFEPFVTARAEGTGLGLALVQEIAKAHGGSARLLPTDSGAEFEIEVPWRQS